MRSNDYLVNSGFYDDNKPVDDSSYNFMLKKAKDFDSDSLKKIINFLSSCNISNTKVELNIYYLSNKHLHFSDEKWDFVAPSLLKIDREFGPPPMGYPNWFLCSFPDVVYWASYTSERDNIIKYLDRYNEKMLADPKTGLLSIFGLEEIVKLFKEHHTSFECEKPEFERNLRESKTKSNSLLIVFSLVLLFGCGFYFFSDIISQYFESDKRQKTNEMNTKIAIEKDDSDSTLAVSQEGGWLSNNIMINEFRNGEKLVEASSKAEWDKACLNKVPAYCHVNYDSSNDEKYGLLYNWYVLTDERNICPEGYRLPKKSDFEILISDSIEKNRVLNLKKNLPGYRDSDGYFKALNELLVIWSSEERFSNCIEALVITKNKIKMECYSPCQAYSIRFIQSGK